MKQHFKKLVFPIMIIIGFLVFHAFSQSSPTTSVTNAFEHTAKAFSFPFVESVCQEHAFQQDFSLSLKSIQSKDPDYQYLDDLSGLNFSLSAATSNHAPVNGSYALQYSAMPLLSGSFQCSSQDDFLSIQSHELWEGSLQFPVKSFGSDFQHSQLKTHFPPLPLSNACSLEPLSNVLENTPFTQRISDFEAGLRNSDVILLKEFPQNISSHIPSSEDCQFYQITISPELDTLVKETFATSFASPVIVSVNRDDHLCFLTGTLLNGTQLSISCSDFQNNICQIYVDSPNENMPSIEVALSIQCKQQVFQVDISSFKIQNVALPLLSSQKEFTVNCKGTYSLMPLTFSATASYSEDSTMIQSPFLMDDQSLDSLEVEIWNHINASPQLKMFFYASKNT